MIQRRHRIGMVAVAALLASAAACSKQSQSADPSLAADLKAASSGGMELAPTGNPGQVVVSAIEGGPQAAPKKAAPARVYKPSPKPVSHVASRNESAPAPMPAPQPVRESAPAPSPTPVEPAPTTTPAAQPAPVRAQQRQQGTYKTEAEIFRQMPWIRP